MRGSIISKRGGVWLLKWDDYVLKDRRRVRLQRYKTVRGTKQDAEQSLAAVIAAKANGTYVAPERKRRGVEYVMHKRKEARVSAARMGWTREKRLAALIKERGLSTRGFNKSLRGLAQEFGKAFCGCEPCDRAAGDKCSLAHALGAAEECTTECDSAACAVVPKDACIEHFGAEWFNLDRRSVVPAAYEIVRAEKAETIYDVTIHVYEVENTAELPDWKLALYGDLADRDLAQFELHILDKYDHEIVIPHDNLMCFAFMGLFANRPTAQLRGESEDYYRQLKKDARSRAVAQHHAPVIVDAEGAANLRAELAKAQRQLEKGDVEIFQEVVYGLGSGLSHADLARKLGMETLAVSDAARRLRQQGVNPKLIVKDSHARWKAAYDAVRELGIQP